MSKENIKSVHLTEKTHELLTEKRKEIYEKTKIDIKLSELADILISSNVKTFELRTFLDSNIN
jgi:hypothetical protein